MRHSLLTWAEGVMLSRPYDVSIGEGYVHRWMVYPKNKWRNIYIHKFNGDDIDGALHDHEPDNVSVLLQNDYYEHFHIEPRRVTAQGRYETYATLRREGDIVGRLASTPHRISLVDTNKPVITLFLQGPRRRKWGFHCVSGWVPWEKYIDATKGYGDRSIGCPS